MAYSTGLLLCSRHVAGNPGARWSALRMDALRMATSASTSLFERSMVARRLTLIIGRETAKWRRAH